jgi:NAD(P)-dependent dehydrogenase (short-subunit alcohol dehydrogenase family)
VSNRTIVITGASDGIGAAAARQLHTNGEHVVLVGRSAEKTRAIAAELGVDYHLADFSRLADVRALAATLLERYPRIDVLANNAGGIMGDRVETEDGHEMTFQVNHLAPFLLTTLLMDRLIESRATIINTASVAARIFAKFDIDDLELTSNYSANAAYGNAKLANILFTRELDRRYGASGISTAAFHPGVVGTGFASKSSGPIRLLYTGILGHFLLTPAKGADTLIWLAEGTPGTDWQRGGFYTKRKIAKTNPLADDTVVATQLWNRSAQMVHIP